MKEDEKHVRSFQVKTGSRVPESRLDGEMVKWILCKLVLQSNLIAYPGVQDNRSTLNTKTGYDETEEIAALWNGDIIDMYTCQERYN